MRTALSAIQAYSPMSSEFLSGPSHKEPLLQAFVKISTCVQIFSFFFYLDAFISALSFKDEVSLYMHILF